MDKIRARTHPIINTGSQRVAHVSLGQLGALMFKHVEPTRHVCVRRCAVEATGDGGGASSEFLFVNCRGCCSGEWLVWVWVRVGWLVGWLMFNIGDAQQLETLNCIFI